MLSRRKFLKGVERSALGLAAAHVLAKTGMAQPRDAAPVDWDSRVDALLGRDEPDDIIVTAVGDMIWNRELTHFPEPDYRNLYRILQEAEIAYGNLEMSLNERPDLQRGLYNYRKGREFGWEIARLGINLVSLGNNHAFDYGPEGLEETLDILSRSGIAQAGGGRSAQDAQRHAEMEFGRTKLSLLSYYSSEHAETGDEGPAIATINAPSVLIEGEHGSAEAAVAPLESDVKAMEDAIRTAKARTDIVIVHYHLHWVSHSRAYPIPDQVPAHQHPMVYRAIDAGADMIVGNGPHVLRGIEIYKGKPIFYSLGNFIYQYKTPEIPPVIWTRDQQQDIPEEFQTVVPRLTVRDRKIARIELIPCTLEMTGPRTGCPKLADDARGREIIALMRRLSKRYDTRIRQNGWYGEVAL
ncbi:MAG: CapA family protein [Sphingomonadales bacterium]|nr:CapA family protein [Sphingomonadales bacterium]